MNDSEILALYLSRDERAIAATAEKYENYCLAVARNILDDEEDGKECVNDTWLAAWESIPPHQPEVLSAFLAKITRNLAFSRWRKTRAKKRGGSEVAFVLEELEQCVQGKDSLENEVDARALSEAVNEFLTALDYRERVMFLRRYWYADSVRSIARAFGKSENAVTKALGRTRAKLRKNLTERGFTL